MLQGDCTLKQALIKDKRNPNLYLLAASQTKDKTALTVEGVGKMLQEMRKEFDFVLCDSPAGIESGAQHAMYFADDAIIVTNPELSSCRDSDKMIGFISSRSKRAELGQEPVRQSLLVTRYVVVRTYLGPFCGGFGALGLWGVEYGPACLPCPYIDRDIHLPVHYGVVDQFNPKKSTNKPTRYDPTRAEKEECLRLDDIKELLGLELLGVIPESKCILTATNIGQPAITMQDQEAGQGAWLWLWVELP